MNKLSSVAEIEKEIDYRESVYAFLARVYRIEVNQELWEEMIENFVQKNEKLTSSGEGEQLLKDFLTKKHDDVITDLAVDYVDIFIGAERKAGAPLYESIYTSKEHLIMQEARDQVLSWFHSEGLERSEKFKEPEDHFAFELEFMMYLCQKSRENLLSNQFEEALTYLNKQKSFLHEHLLNWAPRFLADVQKSAGTDFYKAIAKITRQFLIEDDQSINFTIEQIQIIQN